MKGSAPKVQLAGFCLLAATATLGLLHFLRHAPTSRNDTHAAVAYAVHIISQEAASPGKVIQAVEDGRLILRHVCEPTDAALAVVAARELRSGNPAAPHFVSAKDDQGRDYVTRFQAEGPAVLIVLQGGFAKRPPGVNVRLDFGPIATDMPHATVRLTRIAEPRRLLAVPTSAETSSLTMPARAEYSDGSNALSVTCGGPVPAGEKVEPRLLATSFGAGSQLWIGMPYLSFDFGIDYGRDIDAVKVRLDRLRFVDSEVTLKYRKARILTYGTRRYIEFPNRQEVGRIFNYTAWVGSSQSVSMDHTFFHTTGRRGQFSIALRAPPWPAIPIDLKKPVYPTPPRVEVIGIKPDPGAMDLDFVRVNLRDPSGFGVQRGGFDETVASGGLPLPNPRSTVCDIEVRLRLRKPILVGSTIEVLPVRHVR